MYICFERVWKGAIGKADSHLETDIQTKFSDVLVSKFRYKNMFNGFL